MMEIEVSETVVFSSTLIRLIAQGDFSCDNQELLSLPAGNDMLKFTDTGCKKLICK
jgi:hypothetical protein